MIDINDKLYIIDINDRYFMIDLYDSIIDIIIDFYNKF